MFAKRIAKEAVRLFGLDVVAFTPARHPVARRRQLFKCTKIDLVLDVGANSGHYGEELRRELHYKGRIVSFEPLSAAFSALSRLALNDPTWEVFNVALGDSCVDAEINVAGNSESSSILEMLPAHLSAAPQSAYVQKEKISVVTLDSLRAELLRDSNRVWLKIDTQGFEKQVLEGAIGCLDNIHVIEMELSFIPLYRDQALIDEIIAWLRGYHFHLTSIVPVFSDPSSGHLLQVDGLFCREEQQ